MYEESFGWDIQDFHYHMKKGDLLPMTPFSQYRSTGAANGSKTAKYDPPGYTWSSTRSVGNWVPYSSWVIPHLDIDAIAKSNMTDNYVQEAMSQVYSEGFDLLTYLAELSQLKHLFAGAATTLLKLKWPRNWKDVSCEWLAYRYGWRPFIGEIRSIIELINEWDQKVKRYSKRSGHTFSYREFDSTEGYDGYFTYVQSQTDEIEVSLRGSVTADVVLPKLQLNLLQTGWELVPLSFVLDWFLGIGTAISAITVLSHNPSYVAAKGIKVTWKRDWEHVATPKTYVEGDCSMIGSCVSEMSYRTPCTVPLKPHFKLNLDAKKILDLISLVIQRKT
jgi:hypothetical protein